MYARRRSSGNDAAPATTATDDRGTAALAIENSRESQRVSEGEKRQGGFTAVGHVRDENGREQGNGRTREHGSTSRPGSDAGRRGVREGRRHRGALERADDTLWTLLDKMCAIESEGEDDKDGGVNAGEFALRDRAETEARSADAGDFLGFRNSVHARVGAMIGSADTAKKMGGLRAIDQLIDVEFGEEVEKVRKFAEYVLEVMPPGGEERAQTKGEGARHPVDVRNPLWGLPSAPQLIELMTAVIGRLVAHGGALTTDMVDSHVQRAVDLLETKEDNKEALSMKHYAAVRTLSELARNAPTIFNVHVQIVVVAIWSALRDPSLQVREAAVSALRDCLMVIEQRETRYRVQWYYSLYESCRVGLRSESSVEAMHGSLLALGELLRYTGEFMLSRYREVAQTIFRLQDCKASIIRRTIVLLIPKLAVFSPRRFAESYLVESCALILTTIRASSDSGAGFEALSQLADAMSHVINLSTISPEKADVGGVLLRYLPEVSAVMYDLFTSRARDQQGTPEALKCAGSLMNSLNEAWKPHFMNLMTPMFMGDLSEALVSGLDFVAKSSPELMPEIQMKLADSIESAISQGPETATPNRKTVQLALRTMRTFPFEAVALLRAIKKNVVPYLSDSSAETRLEAALTCCSTLRLRVGSSKSATRAVEYIMAALIPVAVGDTDASIRSSLLSDFCRPCASIDSYLGQAKSLRALFLTVNDESVTIRMLGIELLGHLATRNPAYVLPALRAHMLQLLAELEFSSESLHREESAKVLAVLIRSCPRFVAPYLSAILKVLTATLRADEGGSSATSTSTRESMTALKGRLQRTGSSGSGSLTSPIPATLRKRRDVTGREKAAVLGTIGELANVSGSEIKPFVQPLLALLLIALKSPSTRDEAVVTLGKLIESSGYVADPFTTHPQLLPQLLRILANERGIARNEVLRTLGCLGALDPYAHKANEIRLHGEGVLSADGVRGVRQASLKLAAGTGEDDILDEFLNSADGDDEIDVLPTLHLTSLSDEYYPTIALNSLLRILRDPTRTSHRLMVIRSIVYIFQVLDTGCVQYLPNVLPVMLNVIRTSDPNRREDMFVELATLVSVVKAHIRRYLTDIFELMHLTWDVTGMSKNTILLCEELSFALNDEFRKNLPTIIPSVVAALGEAERLRKYDLVPHILHALECFGASLNDHLYLLMPPIMRLLKHSVISVPVEIKKCTLESLRRILPIMNLSDQAALIVHSLTRVLDDERMELRMEALCVLTSLEVSLGRDYALFLPVVKRAVSKCGVNDPAFDEMVKRVESGSVLLYPDEELETSSVVATARKKPDIQRRLSVNQLAIRRAWESSQRSTKEDWLEWMRQLALDLLKSSPLPSLRACSELAQVQPNLARDLFCASFVSCWAELNESHREVLVRSLEAALGSPTIPPEIVSILLNLCEFMEHDEKPIPVDVRTLGMIAERSRAYAKALHYKELEFATNPGACVAAIIAINNQLQLPEAARGVLVYAQENLSVVIKESWYEKLEQWDDALEAYKRKMDEVMHVTTPHAMEERREAMAGQLRCLNALAEWEEIHRINEMATKSNVDWDDYSIDVTTIATKAAWYLGDWEQMEVLTDKLERNQRSQERLPTADRAELVSKHKTSVVNVTDCDFYKSIIAFRKGNQEEARMHLSAARDKLGTELPALVRESYDRSYRALIRAQQLTELDEVIEYAQLTAVASPAALQRQEVIRKMWRDRIYLVKRDVEVWQELLQVRSLVLPMSEETDIWLKFAALNRKQGRDRQSRRTLLRLLGYDPMLCAEETAGFGAGSGRPKVMFAFIKHLWHTGQKRQAFMRLQSLAHELRVTWENQRSSGQPPEVEHNKTVSRAFLKLGKWRWALTDCMNDETLTDVLMAFRTATAADQQWSKAWHHWALFNATAMEHFHRQGGASTQDAMQHVAPAISGFFRSIALGGGKTNAKQGGSLQDILRLLTLWFNHGGTAEVETALIEGFGHVSIDTWLAVIPQIVARIHTHVIPVRNLIYQLLIRVGRQHPQAVLYPLLVACKSQSTSRRAAANAILDNVRQHSALLVEQAQIVSLELIRVAIVWHEAWHEALEEASRLYFGEQNVDGMMAVLTPLHHILERQGAETLQEMGFVQNYGRELQEAHDLCQKYQMSKREEELNQAWDLYYHVFKRITKQLPTMTTLELQYVSPRLLNSRGLELCVPGNYISRATEQAKIRAFAPTMHVITSKQRPRRLQIHGSDGKDYGYLLKGHEDLRQDERVMQLFGLVNTLLNSNMTTQQKDLGIARYAVVPLSPNSGLIGWVPNCDTLHALIREYREAHKIPLNLEHRMMLAMAPDYDHLPLVNKVEIFMHAVENTSGGDLAHVLWLKSRSSEQWLERRTTYTRSLAVMSMVGYLLGLGDRHPSNLMIDRYSGKVLHIDFGDCFEASMYREKFPEKVPFRLTRMLVRAMEVSGIEGNFRSTCESVVTVLRDNKDSVMAMLEAFVHDPLINWRLLTHKIVPDNDENEVQEVALRSSSASDSGNSTPQPKSRGAGSKRPPSVGVVDTPSGPVPSSSSVIGVEAAHAMAAMSSSVRDHPSQAGSVLFRRTELIHALETYGMDDGANEALNERAVSVMQRMSAKLTGRDGEHHHVDTMLPDTVEKQVRRLVAEATSAENLSVSYVGWCPWW